MRPLERDCAAGQIDINTAAVNEIARTLRLADPVAASVVSGRPWHRSADLISVPGIGPSKSALLAEAVCATPTELPPRAPLACVAGSDAVDLQSATVERIEARTGLGRPAVERLVSARPLPQNLEQVVPPRVPGLSLPAVKRLVDTRAVCVTPAPFRFAGTSWRWATGAHGAVTVGSDPRYVLYVPPGKIAGETGAWATVKALPGELGVLPSADFHIHGQWRPEVAVRVPAPPHSDDAEDVIVAHDRGDGEMSASFDQGAIESATPYGRVVTAAASSLSTFTTYVSSGCDDPVRRTGLFACSDTARRDTTAQALSVQWATATAARQARSATNCDVRNVRARTIGFTTGGLGCTADMDAESGVWTFANDSGLFSGVVFPAVPSEGTFERKITRDDMGVLSGWLAGTMIEGGHLPPKTTLTIRKNVGSGDTTLSTAAAPGHSAVWIGAQQFISLADEALDLLPVDEVLKAHQAYISCVGTVGLITGPDTVGSLFECLSGPIAELVELAAARYATGDGLKARLASSAKLIGKFFGRAFIVVDLFVSAGSIWESQNRTVKMRTLAPPPAPPVGGQFGGPSGDGSFVARDDDGRAYVVEPISAGSASYRAVHIATNGDFNCLVQSRFVFDDIQWSQNSDGQMVLVLPGGGTAPVVDRNLTCDPSGPAWNHVGVRHGGNVPDNVIVKMPDWLGRGSWFINGEGKISPIADGGTYLCLAHRHPVIYNVPLDRIQAWPDVAEHPAACS
ncbi:helix-hairpin-helix domain-containing protein [Lentzea sp. BCCO 10_0798]|uniref:Helix-hairpin-helix domain-containing protein n=1 Tax=Lentzea kristufekii TaxID=3095430 RepID=A0ABU4TZK3_9PSEU|nr:helix-hairpin-helix domain-containing protein [Lentzea sp. BCCO 10_0798]MDX8053752.1 helix-hairpin-helix domain-containing protein [Lentzea sp. BCCO 10_0798]